MNGQPLERSTTRRRWYQFSLRTLIVAMVVVSLLLGLFAARLQRARGQAAAVARIQKVGGSVNYDFQMKRDTDGSWLWVDRARSPVPATFLRWLGKDFFHDVIAADLRGENAPSVADMRGGILAAAELPQLEQLVLVNDGYDMALGRTELEAIAKCRSLRRLTLGQYAVGNNGLLPLEALPHLESLSLGNSSISDHALRSTLRLGALRQLDLHHTHITDRELAELRSLTSLENLDLSGTAITGAGMDWPPSLKVVDLWGSSFSDAGVATLVRCSQIERLDLRDTQVTDAGLVNLASLCKLQRLHLDWTPITDEGLVHVSKLRSLRELSLNGVKISSDGAKHLLKLPSLESLDLSGTFVDGEFDWPASLLQVDLDDSCITNKGLQRLAECPKLRRVSLGGRNLATADGEKAFREARPDVDTTGF